MKKFFVESGIPGASISGRVLARRGTTKWTIPGADASTITYLNNNQIPAPLLPSFYKTVLCYLLVDLIYIAHRRNKSIYNTNTLIQWSVYWKT